MSTINLKEKTVEELKALAYDLLLQQRFTSNNLQMVEQEINTRYAPAGTPNGGLTESEQTKELAAE